MIPSIPASGLARRRSAPSGWLPLLAAATLSTATSAAQDVPPPRGPALVPLPASMELGDGHFPITANTTILIPPGDAETRQIAEILARLLAEQIGAALRVIELPRDAGSMTADHVRLLLRRAKESSDTESYRLTVTSAAVTLESETHRGLRHATQTLRQLITSDAGGAARVPIVRIADEPRFRWRGMLLDCCRHFMPKEFVKRYIELLAYHKLNVLHWHLTEDQGWRIEIKRYPKLTEIGAWRRATRESEQPRDEQGRYGGYYTQSDIREIVAYAAMRGITVVPEIELPGHSRAALAGYPELSCTGGPFEVGTEWGVYDDVYCAGSDATFELLQHVLDEVVELFPSEYVHIGGDECPKVRWKACSKCQARMKAEGLKDEHELQSYFIRRIEKHLKSKGKRLIGWDEILEGGLAPNATVQSWRGMDGAIAAATAGHDVICSPTSHCYLDYPQAETEQKEAWMGLITLEKAYSFEPLPDALTREQAKHVLGLEGNLWSERAPPPDRVDWQVFPRLCALAEVGWSPRESRDYASFQKRIEVHAARLRVMGVKHFTPPSPTQPRP